MPSSSRLIRAPEGAINAFEGPGFSLLSTRLSYITPRERAHHFDAAEIRAEPIHSSRLSFRQHGMRLRSITIDMDGRARTPGFPLLAHCRRDVGLLAMHGSQRHYTDAAAARAHFTI